MNGGAGAFRNSPYLCRAVAARGDVGVTKNAAKRITTVDNAMTQA
jgi:hypothetical protein